MLSMLLAGAVLAGPNPQSATVPAVRARANLGEIFGEADYPWPALIRSEQGVVRLEVSVDPAGSVEGCRVTDSSGSERLDEATCRILRERARYAPARNSDGDQVADRVTAQINWQLPPEPENRARARANLASYVQYNDYPPEAMRLHQQGTVGFALVVSAEGRVEHCEVLQSSGSTQLDGRTCQIMLARARFQPARDNGGHPASDIVTARITWMLMN